MTQSSFASVPLCSLLALGCEVDAQAPTEAHETDQASVLDDLQDLTLSSEPRWSTLCSEHVLEMPQPGGGEPWSISGTLCSPLGDVDTVELLVHGATYDRWYWSAHVPFALASSRATFAYDRLGAGASSLPPAFAVGVDLSAYANAVVVAALRDGTLGQYEHVVQIGHSFGSLISVAATVAYGDVDALVLTGFANQATKQANDLTFASVYPAIYDPKFAGALTDENYFTTIPGARASLFFNANAYPWALGLDEENKDLMPLGLILDISRHYDQGSLEVDVPVLMLLGDNDLIYCGEAIDCSDPQTYQAYEQSYFAQPTTWIIPDAGHSLALHRNAWLTSTFIELFLSGSGF